MNWLEFFQVIGLILIFVILAGVMLSVVLDEVCERIMDWVDEMPDEQDRP